MSRDKIALWRNGVAEKPKACSGAIQMAGGAREMESTPMPVLMGRDEMCGPARRLACDANCLSMVMIRVAIIACKGFRGPSERGIPRPVHETKGKVKEPPEHAGKPTLEKRIESSRPGRLLFLSQGISKAPLRNRSCQWSRKDVNRHPF